MRKIAQERIEKLGNVLRDKIVAGEQINIQEFCALMNAVRAEALRGYQAGDVDWNDNIIAVTVYREDMGDGITKLDSEKVAMQIADSCEVEKVIYDEFDKYQQAKQARKRGKNKKK